VNVRNVADLCVENFVSGQQQVTAFDVRPSGVLHRCKWSRWQWLTACEFTLLHFSSSYWYYYYYTTV